MKNQLLLSIAILFTLSLSAQNEKFIDAMNANKAKTPKTNMEFLDLAASYERIALAEKNEWTPWYYAAFNNINAFYEEKDVTKRKTLNDLILKQIEEGLKIKPTESELIVLKIMAYYGLMELDMANAGSLYLKTKELSELAKNLNCKNPRIYLMEAEAVINMPVEYGGGFASAKPLLEKAKQLFSENSNKEQFEPDWGLERCNLLLSQKPNEK
jgi:hypothetical protein